MVGHRPGLASQLQKVCDLFKSAGYPVVSASALDNRLMRLAHIVATLIRQRSSIDMLVIDVFSGASFVVADVASWLGKRFGKPIVMVLRGGALPQFISRHPRWTMRVLSRAGAIIAPSEFLARVAAKQGLRPRVIPNVIDLSVYPYRHRRKVSPRLFWMRSFHSLYNPSMAVRVVARLRSLMPDASLVMAGLDKGLQSSVRQLADEMGLNGTVRFPGVLDTAGKAPARNAEELAATLGAQDKPRRRSA